MTTSDCGDPSDSNRRRGQWRGKERRSHLIYYFCFLESGIRHILLFDLLAYPVITAAAMAKENLRKSFRGGTKGYHVTE
jgi:hypothetical protein